MEWDWEGRAESAGNNPHSTVTDPTVHRQGELGNYRTMLRGGFTTL